MPDFDPVEFHNLAATLLNTLSGRPVATSGPDQARVRTAIGRAYYAAFLVAREKLSDLGRITLRHNWQDHRLVVDALGGETSDLGGKMHHLRRKRNQADYNLNPSGFTLLAGRHWIEIASDIVAEVNKLS